MIGNPLLEVEDLTIQYETGSGMVTAVSNASFTIDRGEYFGLAGESGCGKSTIAKAIIGGLDPNGQVTSGTITYDGDQIQDLSQVELNSKIRWREISLIPQGSMSSLDPLQRIRDQAAELASVHEDLPKKEAVERLSDMFEIVGLPVNRMTDYPHQFSGGMQQRVLIALAMFLEPSLIIADEPTTALDVIMQDQIFKYLDRIKEEANRSMMLITHDISLILETCDDMAIMHAGQVAETGSVVDIHDNPRHPYSILLQRAFPDIRHPERELEDIDGQPPQVVGEVASCTFADRCPWAVGECRDSPPGLKQVVESENHRAACFRKDEVLEMYRNGEIPGVDGGMDS